MNVAMSTSSINEFVAEYVLDPTLEDGLKNSGKNENHCVLSTIHSAKGLEASLCYVINVSTFSFPTSRAILNGEDAIEEERRCLYVALTRAKDRLYLYRDIKCIHVSEENTSESDKFYFLNDLPEEITDNRTISDSRYLCDEEYKGQQIEIENDFNFD
jgi:DNA helicase-2/ATP-dependent DNA helicase PcrA